MESARQIGPNHCYGAPSRRGAVCWLQANCKHHPFYGGMHTGGSAYLTNADCAPSSSGFSLSPLWSILWTALTMAFVCCISPNISLLFSSLLFSVVMVPPSPTPALLTHATLCQRATGVQPPSPTPLLLRERFALLLATTADRMLWCTEDQLDTLIRVARLDGVGTSPPSPEERRHADASFMALCREAANAGDTLFLIALNPQRPFAVRLNAAFALEPLLKAKHWSSASHFQDRQGIVAAVLQFVQSSPPVESDRNSKLLWEVVTGCLARIVACEYTSCTSWHGYIRSLVGASLRSSLGDDGGRAGALSLKVLQALAHTAWENAGLWMLLAGDVASALAREWLVPPPAGAAGGVADGAAATAAEHIRLEVLRFLLCLLEKRPRPSAAQEAARRHAAEGVPHEAFLLSNHMAACVVDCVRWWCTAAESVTLWQSTAAAGKAASPPSDLEECDVLLCLAQRLVKSSEIAVCVFQFAAGVLASAKPVYMDPQADLVGRPALVMQNTMECLLSGLQTFPGAAEGVSPMELLDTLVCFMLPRPLERSAAPLENEDCADEERTLGDLVLDDEVVPLGCAGGDIPSLASSVLELYLEAFPSRVSAAAQAIRSFMGTIMEQAAGGVARPVLLAMTSATARALRATARVCADSNAALMDAVEESTACHLHTCVASLMGAILPPEPVLPSATNGSPVAEGSRLAGSKGVAEQRADVVAALLLEAYSLSFEYCTRNGAGRAALVALAHGCYDRSSGPCRWVCVLCVGRLAADAVGLHTETQATTRGDAEGQEVWQSAALAAAWLDRALSVMTCTSADASATGTLPFLPIHCGGMAVCALLDRRQRAFAEARALLARDLGGRSLISAALRHLVLSCQTRSAAELLTRMLKACALHTQDDSDCLLASVVEEPLAAVVDLAMGSAAAAPSPPPPPFSVVCRSVARFALELAQQSRCGGTCHPCSTTLLQRYCLPILVGDAQGGPLLLDEGDTRARCTALVAVVVVLALDATASVGANVVLPPAGTQAAFVAALNVARGAVEQRLSTATVSTACAQVAILAAVAPHLSLLPIDGQETVSGALSSPPGTKSIFTTVNATLFDSVPFSDGPGTSLTHSGGFNFMGQWLLQCVQLIACPQWLPQLLFPPESAPASASPHAQALFAWGCSLLPFTDDLTALYALSAFARVLSCCTCLDTPLPACCVLSFLPSVLAKTIPSSECIYHARTVDAIAFAVVSAKARRQRTTKVRLFPVELTAPMAIADRFPHLTGGLAFPLGDALPTENAVDALCDALLTQLSAMGFTDSIASVTSFVDQRKG